MCIFIQVKIHLSKVNCSSSSLHFPSNGNLYRQWQVRAEGDTTFLWLAWQDDLVLHDDVIAALFPLDDDDQGRTPRKEPPQIRYNRSHRWGQITSDQFISHQISSYHIRSVHITSDQSISHQITSDQFISHLTRSDYIKSYQTIFIIDGRQGRNPHRSCDAVGDPAHRPPPPLVLWVEQDPLPHLLGQYLLPDLHLSFDAFYRRFLIDRLLLPDLVDCPPEWQSLAASIFNLLDASADGLLNQLDATYLTRASVRSLTLQLDDLLDELRDMGTEQWVHVVQVKVVTAGVSILFVFVISSVNYISLVMILMMGPTVEGISSNELIRRTQIGHPIFLGNTSDNLSGIVLECIFGSSQMAISTFYLSKVKKKMWDIIRNSTKLFGGLFVSSHRCHQLSGFCVALICSRPREAFLGRAKDRMVSSAQAQVRRWIDGDLEGADEEALKEHLPELYSQVVAARENEDGKEEL
ncbi:uncharacterized protein [Penaeus vannamei]|uniref:uncharacterized protein n=1 Tax=Penaeus vannamei TaxID=6689 RepID=UPI00387F91F6